MWSGTTRLRSRVFSRLFVEPGRTREGYIVFPSPGTAATVRIILKEEGDNGRVLSVPVDYPF